MAVVVRPMSCQRLTYKVFFELHFDFPHRWSTRLLASTACTARHLSIT